MRVSLDFDLGEFPCIPLLDNNIVIWSSGNKAYAVILFLCKSKTAFKHIGQPNLTKESVISPRCFT